MDLQILFPSLDTCRKEASSLPDSIPEAQYPYPIFYSPACPAKSQSTIVGRFHVTIRVGGSSVGCLQVSMWNASNFCCCDRYRENHATANPFPCPNPERNNPLHDDTGVAGNTLEIVLVSCLLACRYICDMVGRGKLTGQSSAASFPTGPVIADPFISPFGLTICRNSVSQNPLYPIFAPVPQFPTQYSKLKIQPAPILQV